MPKTKNSETVFTFAKNMSPGIFLYPGYRYYTKPNRLRKLKNLKKYKNIHNTLPIKSLRDILFLAIIHFGFLF